jgi:oligoendopeptidase F
MKGLMLLAAAATAAPASQYHFDSARYLYTAPRVEQARRFGLLAEVDAFAQQPASSLGSPAALARWLTSYDSLIKRLNRHDTYVYLRAEEDTNDHADAAADDALGSAIARMGSAAEHNLAQVGVERLKTYFAADAALAPYRSFVDSMLARAARLSPCATAGAALTRPALESLAGSYETLDNRVAAAAGTQGEAREAGFAARWNPYLRLEERFASLLIPIVGLREGEARLRGFPGAPAAAYFDDQLSPSEVTRTLQAVRESEGYRRYVAVLAAAASRRMHLAPAALHAWDLEQTDAYQPGRVAFPEALRLILAAEGAMGAEYAGQYARLFQPSSGRIEWCRSQACDRTGFSVGYAGLVSGVFYGSYGGDLDSMRAVAHEAGHAVHEELMAEHQPLAIYNTGPKFMSESFAIFNELLFLDHLYRTADGPAARAYYLRRFLDDATFQVWGSAKETALEESIYAAARRGKLHDAADLDALTLRILAAYTPQPAVDPRMRVYWAHDRLYFTDPFYDVNYLFAGLLALEYVRRLADEPTDFPGRYLALLDSGFTDTPRALEKKFLGISLDDPRRLVRDASDLIERRARVLESLYEAAESARRGSP